MSTSNKIIIVALVLFVAAMPVVAQDIHKTAKTGHWGPNFSLLLL